MYEILNNMAGPGRTFRVGHGGGEVNLPWLPGSQWTTPHFSLAVVSKNIGGHCYAKLRYKGKLLVSKREPCPPCSSFPSRPGLPGDLSPVLVRAPIKLGWNKGNSNLQETYSELHYIPNGSFPLSNLESDP